MSQREAERREIQSQQDINQGKNAYRRWVSDKTLAEYYEVDRSTIWRWVKIGKLPPPEKIGDNCTRWDFQKIQESEAA
jgi:prophage regulatory protein